MVLMSFKHSKKRVISLISVIILVIIASMFICFCSSNNNESYAVTSQGKYNLTAKSRDERINFLSQFGWTVENEEIEICDIFIPNSFNKVYEEYNNIQKQQGLDLADYTGKTCKRFTYKITNYPSNIKDVYADILILDNEVIGGDICSAELGGFMHSFFNPTNSEESSQQTFSNNKLLYPVESSTAMATFAIDPDMPNAPID